MGLRETQAADDPDKALLSESSLETTDLSRKECPPEHTRRFVDTPQISIAPCPEVEC